MRGFWLLLVAVLATIGAGIGIEAATMATGPQATFKTAIDSLQSSPYLEMAMSLDAPASGISAGEVRSAVLTVDVASADGHTALRGEAAMNAVDEQISFADEGSDIADIRVVGGDHLYFRAFFSALAKLPSLPASAKGTLSEVGALIGGTWFSVPTSLISGIEKSGGSSSGLMIPKIGKISSAEVARAHATERRLETDLLQITRFSSSSSPAGTTTSATASINDFVTVTLRDLGPLLSGFLPPGEIARARQAIPTTPGRIVAQVDTDGSGTMHAAKLSISSKGQNVSLHAAINHQPIVLDAPTRARRLSPAIISTIERQLAGRQLD